MKMQLENYRYNIADRKNDKQSMLNAAQNMRMLQMQQAQLAEHGRHNLATEKLMGQRIAAAAGSGNRYMLAALGRAEDRAIKATDGYLKTPKGLQDKRSYDDILEGYRKKFGQGAAAGIGYGPTGQVYDDDEEA